MNGAEEVGSGGAAAAADGKDAWVVAEPAPMNRKADDVGANCTRGGGTTRYDCGPVVVVMGEGGTCGGRCSCCCCGTPDDDASPEEAQPPPKSGPFLAGEWKPSFLFSN
jgi:hypothetical protein